VTGAFVRAASGPGPCRGRSVGGGAAAGKPEIVSRRMFMPISRSIARTEPFSSELTSEIASPLASARAVRPMRCT
jgi:hypothetical protein